MFSAKINQHNTYSKKKKIKAVYIYYEIVLSYIADRPFRFLYTMLYK